MSSTDRRRAGRGSRPKGASLEAAERAFARALDHHKAGRLAEAESAYREALDANPSHAGAHYYLAVRLDETGRKNPALGHMARAVEAQPEDAALRNNYGNLLRAAGRTQQAVDAYRRAISIEPAYVNAHFNLGTALEDLGDHAGAEAAFRQAVTLSPDDGDAWNALATALAQQDRLLEAMDGFQRAVRLRPRDPGFAYNHARCLKQLGRPDEAAAEYRRAIALEPGSAAAHYGLALTERLRNDDAAAERSLREALRIQPDHSRARTALAALLRDAGRLEDEAEALEESLRREPDNLELKRTLGELLLEMDRWEEAAVQFEFVVRREPADARAQNGLSRAYVNLRRIDDAVAAAREAIERHPDLADAHSNLGVALRQKDRIEEAVDAYREAVRLDPNFAAAWNNLGLALMDQGDIRRAQECYRKALQCDSDMAAALMNFSRSKKFSEDDLAEIERIESTLAKPELSHEARVNLHFALGKMYEDCRRYDQAFAHYRSANELKKERLRFDPDHYTRWVDQFLSVFTPELFRRCNGFGDPSERPVFIVGMPRSGTTLVEQILSSHPDVCGADELTKISHLAELLSRRLEPRRPYPGCIESLDAETAGWAAAGYLAHIGAIAAGERRVTDKMPTNFFHLGLIAAIFPKARVIHCRRDPMDVAFSNYVQMFAEGHYYSYDLKGIAVYYRGYEKVMAHWREVLPLKMHEVRYEKLVEDQEHESRRLVEFVGLPWDDRCLKFHETARSVRTASNWQVRQPIYKTSTGRWKRFASHLEGLRRELRHLDPTD